MRRWFVISPPYGTLSDNLYEPPEHACDVVEVYARTAREALVIGLRRMRADPECHYHTYVGGSPFGGMRALKGWGDRIVESAGTGRVV